MNGFPSLTNWTLDPFVLTSMPSELCPGERRYIPNQLSLADTVNLQLFSSMRPKESYAAPATSMHAPMAFPAASIARLAIARVLMR